MKSVILLFFVLMSTAASAQVLNGNFESWTNGQPDYWKTLDNWTCTQTQGHTGMGVTSSNGNYFIKIAQILGPKQLFSMPVGSIGISFWYKQGAPLGTRALYNLKSKDTVIRGSLMLSPSEDWQRITIEFPVGSSSGEYDSAGIWFSSMSDHGLVEFSVDEIQFESVVGAVTGDRNNVCSIVPNPMSFDGALKFNLEHDAEVLIGIFDLFGRAALAPRSVSLSKGESSFPLDVADIPSGIFYLKCIIDDSCTMLKLIVSH